jgi:uncharacterized repeat protein (TIGR01451 family)
VAVGTVTPAVGLMARAPNAPPAPTTPPGSIFVRLTPDHLVAPVGSEVFLKASVTGPDGSMTPHERIEWSVARNGVGQLGNMGLNDEAHLFTRWAAPDKIDPWTAVGRTAFYPVSVTGATPGPFGEAQIERGESWVTLTSCIEGMSQVTAFAPDLAQFNQATTSVYWIDAQWAFPATVVAEAGRPHTLTTTITRRSNGAPLAGWVVRYTVGSGGSLGYEGGNTVDARTDAMGRASVEVSPSESGGGITQVGVTIIHPPTIGPTPLPQVELARGAAAITWRTNPAACPPVAPAVPAAPAPYTPAPLGPPTSPPPAPMSSSPPPSLPSNGPPAGPPSSLSPTPDTNSPAPAPFTPPPAGRPRLDVQMRATTAEQLAIGQFVGYELTITNRGDGVARNIQVTDSFDAGLRHEGDKNNEHVIRNSRIRELAPNDSEIIKLDFQLIAPGRQCHTVTVTADGADTVRLQPTCVTAVQASLEVKISGEHRHIVGEVAAFSATIRNTGSSPAAGVELRVVFDPAIEVIAEGDVEKLPDGSALVRLHGDLAPGERRPIRLRGNCRAPSAHACARASVSSMGGAASQDETCLEILPATSSPPPGLGP